MYGPSFELADWFSLEDRNGITNFVRVVLVMCVELVRYSVLLVVLWVGLVGVNRDNDGLVHGVTRDCSCD